MEGTGGDCNCFVLTEVFIYMEGFIFIWKIFIYMECSDCDSFVLTKVLFESRLSQLSSCPCNIFKKFRPQSVYALIWKRVQKTDDS